MLLTPLYKVFNKAKNPQKFFKKHFIAAALTGFVTAYGAAGLIVYNAAKSEFQNREDFKITDLLSWDVIPKYGSKGVAAVSVSYAGDASLIYALTGMAYWRSRRRKAEKSPIPPN